MGAITGTAEADTLVGGAGGDTITGGAGADVLTGGPGIDLFVFASSDSPATTGFGDVSKIDAITDWSAEDRFLFLGSGPAGFGSVFPGSDRRANCMR